MPAIALLILAVLFIALATPAVFAGMWLAATFGTFFLFPVPAAVCVGLACYCCQQAEGRV